MLFRDERGRVGVAGDLEVNRNGCGLVVDIVGGIPVGVVVGNGVVIVG